MTRAPKSDTNKTIATLKARVKELENELKTHTTPAFRFEIDLDARITSADETTARIFGRSPQKLIGHQFVEKDRANKDRVRVIIDHFVKGTPYPASYKQLMVFRLGHPDRRFQLSFQPKRDRRGRIRGVTVRGKDMTLEYFRKELAGWTIGQYALYGTLDGAHIAFLQASNLRGNRFSSATRIIGLTTWMAKKLGYTIKTVPGHLRMAKPELDRQPITRLLTPSTIRALNGCLERKEEHWIQGEIIARDGSRRSARFSITSHPGVWTGQPVFRLIIVDRTEDEHVLRVLGARVIESEKKFRALFEKAPNPVFLTGLDGKLLDCNQTASDFYGIPHKTLLSMQVADLVPPGQRPALAAAWKKLRRDKDTVFEIQSKLGDGTLVELQVTAAIMESSGSQAVLVTCHDITQLKQAGAMRQRMFEIEQVLGEITTDLFGLEPIQVDQGLDRAMQALAEFTGADRSTMFRCLAKGEKLNSKREWCAPGIEPLIEKQPGIMIKDVPWLIKQLRRGQMVHIPSVASLPRTAQRDKKLLRARTVRSLIALPMFLDDGLMGFLTQSTVRSEKTWSDEDIALLRRATDFITRAIERRFLTRNLRRSEERHRVFVEDLNTGFMMLAGDRIWFANRALEAITGYTPSELIEMPDPLAVLLSEADRHVQLERHRADHSHLEPLHGVELRMRHSDGHEITVEVHASSAIIFPGFLGTQVAVYDITDRKQLQQQLQRAARLASVGTLAAGVAHEINNPLAVISVDLLRMQQHPDDTALVNSLSSKMMRMTSRISEITGGLLTFAKASGSVFGKYPLHPPLDAAIELVRSRFDFEHKQLVKNYSATLPAVQGDTDQLQQVFVNVCLNALEAMEMGGTLTVSATAHRGNDTVAVHFTDTGCGMTRETLERVFDPFFSTKDMGTGLGLAISNSIIEEHGGQILLSSTPGKGTTVSVVLPTVKQQRPAARRARRNRKAPKQRTNQWNERQQ